MTEFSFLKVWPLGLTSINGLWHKTDRLHIWVYYLAASLWSNAATCVGAVRSPPAGRTSQCRSVGAAHIAEAGSVRSQLSGSPRTWYRRKSSGTGHEWSRIRPSLVAQCQSALNRPGHGWCRTDWPRAVPRRAKSPPPDRKHTKSQLWVRVWLHLKQLLF